MQALLLQITSNITSVMGEKYAKFFELSPFILGALAVFLFGWILAELASRMILGLAHKLKLETISAHIGLKHFLERAKAKISPSEVIAKGVKAYLVFLFFIEATKIAQLSRVAEFLTEVINYVPDVLIALFIMVVGLHIGNGMQALISTSLNLAKSSTAHVMGLASKYTIFVFAILAALAQLKIAPILVQIMFVGFISMLALAGGLAFGLGGKDVVKEVLEAIKRMELKDYQHHKES